MKIIKRSGTVCLIVFLLALISPGVSIAEERYDFVTAWGSPGTGNGQFEQPYGIVVGASGNVYVADYLNCRIQKFSSTGSFITSWGSLGTGNGQFDGPNGIALDSAENVYVTDENNHRVQKFTSAGVYITKWGSSGAADGQFNYPTGIAIDSANKVYVVDKNNSRVQVFTSAGAFSAKWGSQGSGAGQFNAPQGIAVDPSGNVYVGDTGNSRIQKFSSAGVFSGAWGSPGAGDGQFNGPQHVANDSAGYIYVADQGNTRLQKFSSAGEFLVKWGSSGSGEGQFIKPLGIALDASGNVYAGDQSAKRIQKFAPSCTYTLSASSQAFTPLANSTGTITVSSSPGSCLWTSSAGAAWLTITSGGSGSGSGTVRYSLPANDGAARTGTITVGGQAFTVYQAGWVYSNSIGSLNSIKITDLSGSLPLSGGAILVRAWDSLGNSLSESASAPSLTLSNNGTTTISGTALAARFPAGAPMLYGIAAATGQVVITNVKNSSDGTLNIPSGYSSGTTKFITNSVGPRNSIKVTDRSGALAAAGASITVRAWDTDGNALAESDGAPPLKLFSNGTTTIPGPDLAARFPVGSPMSYEFTVNSSKVVVTNVKSSSDGSINIPYVFTSGTTGFTANSVGNRNTIKISDMSGTLPASGAAVTVAAWDVNGNAIAESASAIPLKLFSNGTTTLSGSDLAARFPAGAPMSYELTVGSAKYIVTNTKSSLDGTITIPSVFTSGTENYAANSISSRTTIKISDMTGNISPAGNDIIVRAWDVNGVSIPESGSAAPLKIYSHGTTTISGSDLAARFPTGSPAKYEFTVWSTKFIVTNLTGNTAGTVKVPGIYSSGVAGGI